MSGKRSRARPGREDGRALDSPRSCLDLEDPAWEGEILRVSDASNEGRRRGLRVRTKKFRDLLPPIDCDPPRPPKGPRLTTEHDLVLVVDFGAQYAQLIA